MSVGIKMSVCWGLFGFFLQWQSWIEEFGRTSTILPCAKMVRGKEGSAKQPAKTLTNTTSTRDYRLAFQ